MSLMNIARSLVLAFAFASLLTSENSAAAATSSVEPGKGSGRASSTSNQGESAFAQAAWMRLVAWDYETSGLDSPPAQTQSLTTMLQAALEFSALILLLRDIVR